MLLSDSEFTESPKEDEAELPQTNLQVASPTNAVAGELTDENQSDLDLSLIHI